MESTLRCVSIVTVTAVNHDRLFAVSQRATESSVNCVLFLFEDAVVDNETKYAFAVIGAFLIAFTTEIIR